MPLLLAKNKLHRKNRLKQKSSSPLKPSLSRTSKNQKDIQKTFTSTFSCTSSSKKLYQPKPLLQKSTHTQSSTTTLGSSFLKIPNFTKPPLKTRIFSRFTKTSELFLYKNLKSHSNTSSSSTCIDNSIILPKAKRKEEIGKFKFLIYNGNNSELIKNLLDLRSSWSEGYFTMPSSVNFIWMPTSQNIKFEKLKALNNTQYVNHLEFHHEISNKSKLFANLTLFCANNKISIWDVVPMTFIIDFRSCNFNSQLHCFKLYMTNAYSKKWPPTHYVGRNVWIMKPAGLNRGRGIMVFDDIDTLEKEVKEITSNKTPGHATTYVIQKYIEKPLLIYNRKFDIRVWVLITQLENCYFFPQGYLRTSSESFTLDSLSSKFVHLTNNAVQKDGKEYGKFESGNQISFKQFKKYLKTYFGNIQLSNIISIMKTQIIISLMAVKGKLNPHNRPNCFEIFGYDFIIDSLFKPWLIEVNTNPCIELSSPLLEQIIPRMLDDALELTIDTVFPTEKTQLKTSMVLNLPQGNMWEFLVCLKEPGELLV
ncbi:hypothetical protein SteCoe_16698 [Stentor coeruleus]|uniref:Tubulin--tyrosine ligase-like protein 9 n=1 Tax=Stentor coeruleus TaxID=5963 RepID=A0A1R2C0P8_9CILI|nr:hypothetical protein SteCoe_16698 [Stentor coeruleus]